MFGTHDLGWFIVAGLLLNMLPGPDSLLIMARSAAQGWRAGSAAALGIGTGTFVHIFAAALGLSALLATSATAFAVVKLAGAAYLACVGWGLLRTRRAAPTDPASPPPTDPAISPPALPWGRIYRQGFLTNALNPKVAMFFLAFVPQFIAPDAPHKALAFLLLGVIFNFNGMLWCHLLAVSTALAGRRLRPSASVMLWFNRMTGLVFIGFGLRLALSERA